MTLNFPASPAQGDQYLAPTGITYVWDGQKWTTLTFAPVGGTGLAYDEGVWTPTLAFGGSSSGIAGTYQGLYTRIGRVVHCIGSIQLTSNGSGTGQNTIGGLPYTVSSGFTGTTAEGGGAVTFLANGGNRLQGAYAFLCYQGTKTGSIQGTSNSNPSDLDIRVTDEVIVSTCSIRLVFTYFTDD